MSAGVVYKGSGLSTIDIKGRATMPSVIRDSVQASSGGNTLYLGRHASLPCLVGFGLQELEEIKRDIKERRSAANNRGADFNEEFAGAAASSIFDLNFEASGRFVIQPMLKFFSKLEGSAFFFATIGNFHIWNPEVFLVEGPAEFDAQKEELRYWQHEHGKRSK